MIKKTKPYIKKIPFLHACLYTILCFFTIITNFFVIFLIKNKSEHSGVLLIKPDLIGDFIIWLDTAKEFRNLYEGEKITVLCRKECAEIANELDYFDKVISIDVSSFDLNFFYKVKTLINIRRKMYKTVIQACCIRIFYSTEAIVMVSGATDIIGFDNYMFRDSFFFKWQKKISDKYYTTLIEDTDKKTIELERNAKILRKLGLKEFKCSLPQLPSKILLKNYLNLEPKKYYVLFPGASKHYRRWPTENFSKIALKIYQNKGWIGIICGGGSEDILGRKIIQNADNIPLINMTGKTSLLELATIIKNAAIIITNETSAVQIAAAVSTSSVCILGGGYYGNLLPIPQYIQGYYKPHCVIYKMNCFCCEWKCIHKVKADNPFPCIQKISIDAVWQKISSLY
jgi:ADP-heptose:LPS heptosyltransferase